MLSFVATSEGGRRWKSKNIAHHTKQNIHVASYSHTVPYISTRLPACLYPMQSDKPSKPIDPPARPFSTTNLQVNKSKLKQDKWYPHATKRPKKTPKPHPLTPSYNSTTSDTPNPLPLLPVPHSPPSPPAPPAPGCQRPTSTPRARPAPHSPPRRAPPRGSSPQTP